MTARFRLEAMPGFGEVLRAGAFFVECEPSFGLVILFQSGLINGIKNLGKEK